MALPLAAALKFSELLVEQMNRKRTKPLCENWSPAKKAAERHKIRTQMWNTANMVPLYLRIIV